MNLRSIDAMDEKRPIVEYEQLNWLGKAVYLGGAATHLAARAIEYGVDRAAEVMAEAERAFKEGLGDDIEEARIIEERPRSRENDEQKRI